MNNKNNFIGPALGGAQGLLGAVTGIPPELVGLLSGLIGGAQQNWAADQSLARNQYMMQQQHNMNLAFLNAQQRSQLEMWEKTNYPAQIEQIKKAGLNPALMYQGGAKPGDMGMATPENVDTGMSYNYQAQLPNQSLQDQYTRSLIEKNLADADRTRGGMQLDNANLKYVSAKTQNLGIQGQLMNIDISLKELDKALYEDTYEDKIKLMKLNVDKIAEEINSITNKNKLDEAIFNDLVESYHLANQKMLKEMILNEAQTKLYKAQTKLTNAKTTHERKKEEETVENIKLLINEVKRDNKITEDFYWDKAREDRLADLTIQRIEKSLDKTWGQIGYELLFESRIKKLGTGIKLR